MAAMAQAPPQTQQDGDDKELRGNIRNLYNRAKNEHHNLVSAGNNGIVDLLKESNQYVEQIKKPRDQAVESEFFNYVTGAARDMVKGVAKGGQGFTAGDFLRRLKARHVNDLDAQAAGAEDPEAFNWAELGQMPAVAALFRTVPVVHHMLGPLDAQPRQRKQVQRQAKRKLPTGEAVRPEEVDTLGDQEKQETDRNMEEMWRVLHERGGRVSLIDLVINHASFAQTVENTFTLSFLVRDDKVELLKNEEEGIMVQQRAAPNKNNPKETAQEKERMQFVIPMDVEIWEHWKLATDPSQPSLMKHRKEWRSLQAQQQQEQQQQQQQEQEQPEEAGMQEEEAREKEEEAPAPRRQQRQRRQQTPEEQEEQQPQQEDEEEGQEAQEEEQQQQQQQQPLKRRKQTKKQSPQQAAAAATQQAATQQQTQMRQPAGKKRLSRALPPQEQRPPAQQQQQQQAQVKQEKPAVKREPQSQPRAQRGQQQQEQQPGVEDVIVISSDSEIVIPDSDSDDDGVKIVAASPLPAKLQQAPAAAGAGRRKPSRGKRV